MCVLKKNLLFCISLFSRDPSLSHATMDAVDGALGSEASEEGPLDPPSLRNPLPQGPENLAVVQTPVVTLVE